MAGPTIRIVIDAVADGLERAAKKAGDTVDKLGTKLGKSNKQTEEASGFFNRLGGAARGAAGDGLGPLGDAAGALGVDLAGASVSTLAAGAALGGMFTLISSGLRDFSALVEEVRTFQAASGATWEESSRLVEVFGDLGVSAQTGADAMAKLARNIDAGKLQEYGITVQTTSSGQVDMAATLGVVADAMAAQTDPVKRATMGADLFGRSWTSLLPVLSRGSAGIREMTEAVSEQKIITPELAERQERLKFAIDDLKDSFGDLSLEAGANAAPAVAQFAESVSKAAPVVAKLLYGDGGQDKLLADRIAEAAAKSNASLEEQIRTAKALGISTADMRAATESAGKEFKSASQLADELTESIEAQEAAERARTAALKEAQRANEEATKAIEAQRTALLGLFNQELSAQQSREALTNSMNELGEATDDYDEKLASTKQAVLSNADAQVALAKKQADSKNQSYDAAAAQRDYRASLIEMRDAAADENLRRYLDELIGRLDEAESSGYRAGSALSYAASKARDFAVASGANEVPGMGIVTPADRLPDGTPGRAAGGPVMAGRAYTVGEVGPELFVPQSNGRILSADDLARVGGGGGQGVTIVVNSPIGKPDDVVRWLREELRRLDRGQR